jgi:hypothetical protein
MHKIVFSVTCKVVRAVALALTRSPGPESEQAPSSGQRQSALNQPSPKVAKTTHWIHSLEASVSTDISLITPYRPVKLQQFGFFFQSAPGLTTNVLASHPPELIVPVLL